MTNFTPPPDQADRDAALDISGSWIVQAPAGAGKTELLTQRFLKLLSAVDQPEEILAITFTRAATAEMRGRILSALEKAARTSPAVGEPQTLRLARAALAHSQSLGWQLLEQPHRLDVQTIDSLCLRLAHGQPLLSRLGGRLAPTEHAKPLYALAAQRTFARLGRTDAELGSALEHLLLLRDNNLDDCHSLIATMLANREQWRHVFVLSQHETVDWSKVRAQLEAPFAREVQRLLAQMHRILSAEPTLLNELLELARYACANGADKIALLDGLHDLPAPDVAFLEHWNCLRAFLLTKDGHWRKAVTVKDGFPAPGAGPEKLRRTEYKQRMIDLLGKLQSDPHRAGQLSSLLAGLSDLPAPHYDETQWQTLLAVFRVLRHAVAELHVLFAERNQVDFAEISIAAATVLDDEQNYLGLLAGEAKRHLLIDEFQDTSRRQHRLIGGLLREWQPGDRRTCFLVGDPMQSIYIFRQAEVELFARVQRRGLDCGSHAHPCGRLTLSENFRSHRGLVEPLNRYFQAIFDFNEPAPGEPHRDNAAEVAFAPSTAAAPAIPALDAVQVHPFFSFADDPETKSQARRDQITRVLDLVEQQIPNIRAAQAQGDKSYTVVILGRVKNHLAPIAAGLRERGISFRAIELESLAERQEILDLISLLRALLHPLDRIAWLSVLRAPWCGLTLSDLHVLTGADSDDPQLAHAAILELIDQRAHLLSADGRQRLARTAAILARAAEAPLHPLATWLERTWTSLGAPAYLSPGERENAETFFRLLDETPDAGEVLNSSLEAALADLCASPDASASEQFGVQLMTIHKSKGLGFDVVIVPALERRPRRLDTPLVAILERALHAADSEIDPTSDSENQDEILVAPLAGKGEKHPTYQWLQRRRDRREAAERKRLFYVACTRARRQLHLLGTAVVNEQGDIASGAPGSLLASAWPALEPFFADAYAARPAADQTETSQPGYVAQLAASAEIPPSLDQPLTSGNAPMLLRRVPGVFAPRLIEENVIEISTFPRMGAPGSKNTGSIHRDSLERPEGSLEQRARGNAIHAMLEFVSQAWAREPGPGEPTDRGRLEPLEQNHNYCAQRSESGCGRSLRNGRVSDCSSGYTYCDSALTLQDPSRLQDSLRLKDSLRRVARAALRRAALPVARLDALTPSLVEMLLAVLAHPEGRWILGPHLDGRSEFSLSLWTGADGREDRLSTLRVDRVFRAGNRPFEPGSHCLWIIDYKTGAHLGGLAIEAYLEMQRQQWSPQLAGYGEALRALEREPIALRYGLYFPELLRLVCWEG